MKIRNSSEEVQVNVRLGTTLVSLRPGETIDVDPANEAQVKSQMERLTHLTVALPEKAKEQKPIAKTSKDIQTPPKVVKAPEVAVNQETGNS